MSIRRFRRFEAGVAWPLREISQTAESIGVRAARTVRWRLDMVMRLLYYQSFANRSRRGTEHVYSIYDGGRSVRIGQMVLD